METLAVDKFKRVRLPDAKVGQKLAYTNHGNGSFTLTILKPVKSSPAKFKLVKKNGFTVGHTDKQVSLETIRELLAEFP